MAAEWIAAGRVSVDGRVVRDPEFPTTPETVIAVDGEAAREHARGTVYRCFDGAGLPWIAPVGRLRAKSAKLLRSGTRNAWLEIVLDEGRNRQIRCLLTAFDIAVLRLVRTAIGLLTLGDLPKGAWRHLSSAEAEELF